MVETTALLLPILLTAVAVFVLSAVIWMASPLHKNDYRGLPNEDAMLEYVRREKLEPTRYMFPWCRPEERGDEAVQARMKAGPWGVVSILPGGFDMGKMLGAWMLHQVVVALLIGYLCGRAMPAGASFGDVFRIASVIAILAHGAGAIPKAIWEGKPWRQVPGELLDALVYAVATGVVFGWLWP